MRMPLSPSASKSRSPHVSARPTTAPRPFHSKSRTLGSPPQQISSRSAVEEILATKLRALLQREKGRDLVDLAKAVVMFSDLEAARVVALFGKYLKAGGQAISRAEAEQRMWAKLAEPSFLADVRPLLSADDAEEFDSKAERAAFVSVFTEFIKRIPGHVWAETPAVAAKFGMPELA